MCPRRCLVIVALVAAAGCGRSELVPLSGKVTVGGKPLSTGTITFFNTADGPSGHGSVQPDGTYVAQTGSQSGLKPGEYRISVVAYQALAVVNRAEEKKPEAITPSQYAKPETSGLSCTVTESGGTFDIALDSK